MKHRLTIILTAIKRALYYCSRLISAQYVSMQKAEEWVKEFAEIVKKSCI